MYNKRQHKWDPISTDLPKSFGIGCYLGKKGNIKKS